MQTFSTTGVVLKRMNYGEADRLITIFSEDKGKIVVIAKGVRKPTSAKKSALEPGMYSKIFCAETHGLPILTQALVISDNANAMNGLDTIRDLSQVLEIIDTITVDAEPQPLLFSKLLSILQEIQLQSQSWRKRVIDLLKEMMDELGFERMGEAGFSSVTEYVEFISEKKLKSHVYLTVHGK